MKSVFRKIFPLLYQSLFIFKQNLWICHYWFFVNFLKNNHEYFNDDFFSNKKIIIIGPADSSLNYMSSEKIDDFDLIIRIKDSPNTLSKNQNLGTRTDILYHNLYLKDNPIINEQLLLSQKNKFVLYNYNLAHLELNFNLAKHKFKKIKITKVHPSYFAQLIKQYIKHKISPTTGILALNHLMHQNFKELVIVGFTFYKSNYVNGYNGIKSPKHENNYDTIVKNGQHNPKKDLEIFVSLYLRYYKTKKIILDHTLNSIIQENLIRG